MEIVIPYTPLRGMTKRQTAVVLTLESSNLQQPSMKLCLHLCEKTICVFTKLESKVLWPFFSVMGSQQKQKNHFS